MEIINLLADFLANKIKISPPAARGLLKLAIKDQFGPFRPLNQVDFYDLKDTINNTLKERLVKLNVADIGSLIEGITQELIDNQSLISIPKI